MSETDEAMFKNQTVTVVSNHWHAKHNSTRTVESATLSLYSSPLAYVHRTFGPTFVPNNLSVTCGAWDKAKHISNHIFKANLPYHCGIIHQETAMATFPCSRKATALAKFTVPMDQPSIALPPGGAILFVADISDLEQHRRQWFVT